jgi:hypothetical protein
LTLFWSTHFFFSLNYAMLCGAVGEWYFSAHSNKKKKKKGKASRYEFHSVSEDPIAVYAAWGMGRSNKTANRMVCGACCRISKFHLGSVALASLVATTLGWLAGPLRYAERVNRQGNKLQKVLCLCTRCCIGAGLSKVTDTSLVWCALYGDTFCTSSRQAYGLLLRQVGAAAARTHMADWLLFVNTLGLAGGTTLVVGLFLTQVEKWGEVVSSPAVPCAAVFLITFAFLRVFMCVFKAATDTLFLCFLVDQR